jgi:hypothetical protein
MAIVDELILLDATLVGDPIRGRSGSPASSLFKYLVSQDSYGFVRFRHIASLIIPANPMELLDYGERHLTFRAFRPEASARNFPIIGKLYSRIIDADLRHPRAIFR